MEAVVHRETPALNMLPALVKSKIRSSLQLRFVQVQLFTLLEEHKIIVAYGRERKSNVRNGKKKELYFYSQYIINSYEIINRIRRAYITMHCSTIYSGESKQ